MSKNEKLAIEFCKKCELFILGDNDVNKKLEKNNLLL
jgi:hypothetical protein